jgi:hypothetical protein
MFVSHAPDLALDPIRILSGGAPAATFIGHDGLAIFPTFMTLSRAGHQDGGL